MADHSIIFSSVMVEALLAGTKTQTRRRAWRSEVRDDKGGVTMKGPSSWWKVKPGDRLWVREAFALPSNWPRPMANIAGACLAAGHSKVWAPLHYHADGAQVNWGDWREHAPGKTRPPIHMPRWASRITLTVTAVRVQRVQDITEEDAKAEGMAATICLPQGPGAPSMRDRFAGLWDHLHGQGAWEANQEVVAISFSVQKGNIDAAG